MLAMSDGLRHTLLYLQEEWTEQIDSQPSKENLRRLIQEHGIGEFVSIQKMDKEELIYYLNGRTVAGVDGSSNSFGGSYPGTIALLQAGAMTMKRNKYLVGDALSPMSRRDRLRIAEYQDRHTLGESEAYLRYKDERMAQLEVEAALKLLESEEPALMLFDGGFVRYESKAFLLWEEYASRAREKNIFSIGIIEEVGTNFISRALIEALGGKLLPYDRQILFGVLEPGEALFLNTDLKHKGFSGRYYTCFARLSAHPSIIGCDVFLDRKEELSTALRFLFANTLEGSRGVPFWIDRVDHEIKLTYKETEAMIRHAFPPAWVEKFLVSQRSRRDI
ncbi:DNA double-strand break repair nuclease NurA [Ammoniphilus sp. CFH 90114]|uniref:DNA double-strand break repair nuclease NurA n=1 Tax=Ammoniphilus sp. CFH 90114 TaxID=2493665 RepID=UPI0013E9961B|nr:DNA double-strand break repair nuclease NurA [Ammoniphilus sp. CFH 90114]